MSAVVKSEQMQLMTAEDMRARINAVQQVMRAVMKDGVHYGVIPGTDKPTLYKAGSEVLLATFHIGTRVDVQDLSTDDERRYRVKVVGVHQPSGNIVGEGVGECSTSEEKYKWRNAVCDEEFEDTAPNRRRKKFSRKWNKQIRSYDVFTSHQVRTEPSDLANTVLKMAKKRAQIDFTLTALGASDIFTQDIEDLPDELRSAADDDGQPTQPDTPIEHPAMKSAKSVQELAQTMNGFDQTNKKKYAAYFNVRMKELKEAANATGNA